MLPLEFFPLALPLDTLQLVIDGLGVPVEVNKAKQFLQLVQTFMLRLHGRVDGLRPLTLGGNMGLQIFQSEDAFLGQKIDGLGKIFEVPNPGVAAPCPGVSALIIVGQQGGKGRGLGLAQFFFYGLYPVHQAGDFLPNIPQDVVGLSYPAVQIALVGGDALGLHLADGHAFMDSGQQVKPLTLIGAVVDAAGQPLFLKLGVYHSGPRLPPMFQRFRVSPVGSGNSVKEGLAVLSHDAVPVLVQTVDAPLLKAPFAAFLDRPDRAENMKMGVRNTAVLLVRLVDGKVGNHAPTHKLLRNKLPCKSDVFLQRKFVLQGNVKAICKLGFFAALGLLYGVPEGSAVLVLGGSLGRQENVCADHTALVGVVADLAVILAIQFLPGAVGGGRDNGLSRAPLDLGDVEMEQGQLSALLLVGGLAHQGGNFRQGKDLFHQKKKGPLAHAAHLRDDALHRSATGDKAVVSLLPLALGVVADAVFVPLAPVLVLLHFDFSLGALFLQFLACFLHGV